VAVEGITEYQKFAGGVREGMQKMRRGVVM